MAKYSAGLVSRSFWYNEFSQYIDLINSGKSFDDIKAMSVEDNYFKQSSKDRSIRMYQTIKMRIDTLDKSYLELFPSLNMSNQKIVNLVSIMNMDKLFSEFMYESFRDELLLGDSKLYDYEVQSFFDRKQAESDQVAGWTDETVLRLAGSYLSFLREAGLLEDKGEYDDVIRPLIDIRLQDVMRDQNANVALASLLGR
ncbi:DUF1819 family protein [Companilactobacillus hulinensis]|uniref:DUF1819 family protein n=1 Tax=Companilactobacillus hulinensis TaxID=2486007 RepID=UPI0013DE65C6|nr:DUF1819 family protein [Companilactobacillus hulinensis]